LTWAVALTTGQHYRAACDKKCTTASTASTTHLGNHPWLTRDSSVSKSLCAL